MPSDLTDKEKPNFTPYDDYLVSPYYPQPAERGDKCIVKGCDNHTNEGGFRGDLCTPCYELLTTGNVSLSYGHTFIHNLRDRLNMVEVQIAFFEGVLRKLKGSLRDDHG